MVCCFGFQVLINCKFSCLVTDTTGHGVVIFPLSSVAFMIVPLDQVLKENEGQYLMNQDIIER